MIRWLRFTWLRLRLAWLLRGLSQEKRNEILNDVLLEMNLEQYSRKLRGLE